MIAATWITERVSIFQVMDALGVSDGGDETTRQMRCPVHVDSRPSARVYAEENRVHCYTCGRGWDVLGLVMTLRHVSYPEAAQWVVETFGLTAGTSLTAQLRAAFDKPTGSVAPLFQFAEAELRRARSALTCETYLRAGMALDLVQAQYREHADRAKAQKDVARVVAYLQAKRSVTCSPS